MGGKVEPLPPGGKKAVKVKALAAADAARQKDAARAAERAKQREQLERQKAERIKQKEMQKIKAEEERKQQQRELEEARKRKEEEATQRRRALEAAEKREREEKARRLEELRAKRRLEDQRRKEAEAKQHADEERKRKAAKLVEQQEVEHKRARVQEKQQSAAAQPAVAVQNLVHSTVAAAASSAAGSAPTASVLAAVSALEAKARLQPAGSSFNAAMESRADSGKGPSTSSGPPPFPTAAAMSKALGARPLPGLAAAASKPLVAAAATPTTQLVPPGTQSYEISPYKSDEGSESEEEDEEPSKPVPEWARGRQLLAQLVSQLAVDPDEIFQQHAKTCSLDEVFGSLERERPGKKDLSRRTSSSNWIEDRVTWKEEMNYKKAMGYL
ncbi:hypothetical protein WJX72_002212 [[Myrmecia] bisecta]|uniref:Inner centromere protein ARK-binding domain-containing protein n=1 Tax=[Myrmecia] bisecta TaxID=41462 RepID=A0AAW1QEE1_9CHLO